jgi:hypothetical protein
MATWDLRELTRDWPYHAGQITVRKVRGLDHRLKIQMRVDLGILQMNVDGRPDGERPHDCESLLDYQLGCLEAHKRRNGTELGFALNSDQVQEIHDEAMQYYQRYLANFVLEDYDAVARDTQRNLRVLDLCLAYASEEEDRYALEPYRPYICMMNARSRALAALKKGAYRSALAHVNSGLRIIKAFFKRYGDPEAFRLSAEVRVLKSLRREIRRHLPVDPIKRAKKQLTQAVDEERYEDAARLRDELDRLMREREEML